MEDNYYLQIIKEIKLDIEHKKYESSILKIEEELKMPYIPNDIELELKNIYKDLMFLIKSESNLDESSKWNIEKISLCLKNVKDINCQIFAIEALKNFNARKIEDDITDFFLNKNINNESKTMLLFVLAEQEYDKDFNVFKYNKKIVINPKKIDLGYFKNLLLQIYKILDDYIYNENPSLFNIAKTCAESYFYNVFPDVLSNKEGIKELSAAIIYRSYEIMMMQISFEEILSIFQFDIKISETILNKIKKEKIL